MPVLPDRQVINQIISGHYADPFSYFGYAPNCTRVTDMRIAARCWKKSGWSKRKVGATLLN